MAYIDVIPKIAFVAFHQFRELPVRQAQLWLQVLYPLLRRLDSLQLRHQLISQVKVSLHQRMINKALIVLHLRYRLDLHMKINISLFLVEFLPGNLSVHIVHFVLRQQLLNFQDLTNFVVYLICQMMF